MNVYLNEGILYIKAEDVPSYKKGGSVVRNSYFWALKSIACHAPREKDWEFDEVVWVALVRLLTTFTQSGYLGLSETILEFPYDEPIPTLLRSVASQGSTREKTKI